MNLHIEFAGKNAKVSLHALPKLNNTKKGDRFTSAGPVQRQKALNGFKPLPVTKETSEFLITKDDEINLAQIGRILDSENLTGVFLDEAGTPVSDFEVVEVVTDTKGDVQETRKQPNRNANLDTATPVKVTKTFPLANILTRFVFKGTYQLCHEDGLTKSFLYDIAKALHTKQEAAVVGSGLKGAGPLVLRNGTLPVRGFLMGEISGEDYKLFLLTTDTELKRPVEVVKPEEKPTAVAASA
jgi:hypothetical protein